MTTARVLFRLARTAATALVPVLVATACTSAPAGTSPPTVLRMASAQSGPFTQQLVEQYSRNSGTLKVVIVQPSQDAFEALERGEADITLSPADSAYFAYRRSARSREALRALATLQVVPTHLVSRAGLSVQRPEQLRGHTIGATGVGTMADLLVRAMNLKSEPQGGALADGKVDLQIITGYYPAPPVEALMRRGAHLISMSGPAIDRLRQEYPFIRLVTIPAQTYTGQTEPVFTVGAEATYVCRSDLSEAVVYELTKRLFDALPVLSRNFSAIRSLDVTQAAATIIPLHDGAARYYREIELLP